MSKTITLANGVEMPVFGFGEAFGNWSDDSQPKGLTPEDSWSATKLALDAGVRHLDCAYVYNTHRHVRDVISRRFMDGEMQRSDIFITTKVFHPPAPPTLSAAKTFDMLADGVDIKAVLTDQMDKSLEELGLGCVDLLLVHWPGKFDSTDKAQNRAIRKVCWEAFEEFYKVGKARAIGVSNWTEEQLDDLKTDGATVVPHVNQIEMSPYTIYDKIVGYCKANGIVIEAYSPLGSSAGGVLKDDLIVELAGKYGKNPGQLVLRWLVQQGIVVLPRSTSAARIASNMDIFDFEITEEDMGKIAALNTGKSLTNANPYDIP